MLMSDRWFLIRPGCAWLVHDILKQIRFLKYGMQPPKLVNITKNTFAKNPCFNRIFGVIPTVGTNEVLNVLPGLFVIVGIFGTFLGVMKGLPSPTNSRGYLQAHPQTKLKHRWPVRCGG
jgi:hypothetical protein